jgi:hypothetical protein
MSNKLANCHALRMLTIKLLWSCLQPAEMRGNFKMFLETLFMTKKKRIQTFKLYFHKNRPFVQLQTSASNRTGVENIPEAILL